AEDVRPNVGVAALAAGAKRPVRAEAARLQLPKVEEPAQLEDADDRGDARAREEGLGELGELLARGHGRKLYDEDQDANHESRITNHGGRIPPSLSSPGGGRRRGSLIP